MISGLPLLSGSQTHGPCRARAYIPIPFLSKNLDFQNFEFFSALNYLEKLEIGLICEKCASDKELIIKGKNKNDQTTTYNILE